MGYAEIWFPCELKIKVDSWWWFFGDQDLDKLFDYGCPIHGKKCKGVK